MDQQMHTILQSISKEKTAEVRSQHAGGSFRRVFWEQQVQALKTKNLRQMRWHPALINWCLHLKFKSSGAYHALRSTSVLNLPSERTLCDYAHFVRGTIGFSTEVNEQLVKEAAVTEEKDKYVVLVMDEMKIREELVFDKHSCSLKGFVDLVEINDVLTHVESECKSEKEVLTTSVATHMLQFMVRGIFTSLAFPYAHFPTRGATANELFPLFWDPVRNLEMCGFKVMAFTGDSAAANRKLFKMHSHGVKGEVVYKTANPYSDDGNFLLLRCTAFYQNQSQLLVKFIHP